MLIQEMTKEECLDALTRLGFGRLGCARDSEPYVVPIYFAYHDRQLYTFSAAGQKIDWMRANPRVCVEADEIASYDRWLSVVVFGHYEELPDTPAYESERNLAYAMLAGRPMWWEPACVASPHHSTGDSIAPIYYSIHIDRVTGRRTVPDSVEAAVAVSESVIKSENWLLRFLRRARIIRDAVVALREGTHD